METGPRLKVRLGHRLGPRVGRVSPCKERDNSAHFVPLQVPKKAMWGPIEKVAFCSTGRRWSPESKSYWTLILDIQAS